MTTFDEALSRVTGLLTSDAEINRYISQPLLNCENASSRVTTLLQANNIAYEVRGLLTWENAEDGASGNHFVVIAKIDEQRVMIDITAGQFSTHRIGTPIIDSAKNWEEQFLALPRLRRVVIKFRDFPTHALANSAVAATNEPLLTDPAWTLLGEARAWAKDHLDYPRWGSRYAEYQLSISPLTPRSLRPTEEQRTATLAELARLFEKEVTLFKAVKEEIDNGARSIPDTLDDRQRLIAKAGTPDGPSYTRILDELDRYHTEANGLSVMVKMGKLSDLAQLADEYAATHTRNLNDRSAKLLEFAKHARAYAIGLRLRENALGSLDLSQGWRRPSLTKLAEFDRDYIEPTSGRNFRRQLIVQLEGDDVSFNAAMALFSKYPRHTEWVQLESGETWTNIRSRAPLQLYGSGRVKIVLVGHGVNIDGRTLFGGKTVDELKASLTALMAQASRDKIKGIHLDLVGCELLNERQPLATSLPGELGEWLLSTGDGMQISRNNLSLSARKYAVRVTENGKKEILTPEWGWINKEEARLKDVVHKVELVWDAKLGALARKPLPMSGLMEAGGEIESVIHHPGLSDADRVELVRLHQTVGDQVRKQVLDLDPPDAEHRRAIEQFAIKNTRSAILAAQWVEAVQALTQQHQVSNEWLPTLQSRSTESGATELLFIRRTANVDDAEPSRWITTNNNADYPQIHAEINELVNDVSRGLTWHEAEQGLRIRSDLSETDAIHTLNAAFMLKTLIEIRSRNGELTTMSDALKVQVYAQLAQNGIQLVNDGARMGQLIRSALGTELNLVPKAMTLIGRMGAGVNVAFDAINIGAIIVELNQTSDLAARAAIESKLGLSVVGSGVSIAGLIAGVAGAGTVAGVLGALAVPLAGLAVGVPILVENYERLRQGFDQASAYMDAIMNSVSMPGLRQDGQIWQFQPGAVVKTIDFKEGETQYGYVLIKGTKGGSWHTVTGGWDHYLARPDPDPTLYLNVYTGLGAQRNQSFDASQASVVLLPSGVDRHINMDYAQLTGRRTANAPALRRLHEYYGDQFVWGMYAFPTDWGIYQLTVDLEATGIHTILDATQRTLIVPTVVDENERQHLNYHITGGNGTCTVVLPAIPVSISIDSPRRPNPHATTNNEWIFDIDYAVKQHSIVDGKVVLGELKEDVFAGLQLRHQFFSIGGQAVEFIGNDPVPVLVTTIGNVATLQIHLGLGEEPYRGEPCLLMQALPSAQDLVILQRYFSTSTTESLLTNGLIQAIIDLGGTIGRRAGLFHITTGEFLYSGGSLSVVPLVPEITYS
ncbi:Dermonecrotoxin of the Papain-like fold [Pseudomonas sp. LAMO17WK12:I10]|uniref:TcdA/TcdB pore-forming domain-containing protein n=1 Tax=unclassified Pseudomonas TaxID=196821 RepID=UPI000BCE09EE|nr:MULTISPECIES: TcdA/TcdB pore-forming domain-containing protein [unclassified Pseudomonas]PXX63816.1 papain fold dermonecrotoxin of polymorphic toxin system [Pseudomonas sp. LAMO17WK12:I9]SNY39957.1 Dermonecrotoxin of the Papain-like fold [Pseudomonas sp. LAMO17WK12:I10]